MSRSSRVPIPASSLINVKAPTGTRLELTDQYVASGRRTIFARSCPSAICGMIVSNIGVTPGFSSMYTSNSGQHTATVQVSLKEGHEVGSYEYMNRVRHKLNRRSPGALDLLPVRRLGRCSRESRIAGSHRYSGKRQPSARCLQDSVGDCRSRCAMLNGVTDVLIPQDLDYPGISSNVNREMAARMGCHRARWSTT